jgi:hypothetical protein
LALVLLCGPVCAASAQTTTAPAQEQGIDAVRRAYVEAERYAQKQFEKADDAARHAYEPASLAVWKAHQDDGKAQRDEYQRLMSEASSLRRDAAQKAWSAREAQFNKANAEFSSARKKAKEEMQAATEKANDEYGTAYNNNEAEFKATMAAAHDTYNANKKADEPAAQSEFYKIETAAQQKHDNTAKSLWKTNDLAIKQFRSEYAAVEAMTEYARQRTESTAKVAYDAALDAIDKKYQDTTKQLKFNVDIATLPYHDAYEQAMQPVQEVYDRAETQAKDEKNAARDKRLNVWNQYKSGQLAVDQAVAELKKLLQ